MSEGIRNRIGPFHYADGASRPKVFPNGRHFRVVIAGAYNACGLIGSEKNGIAVLDEDNLCVVLDEHCKEASGYNGPSQRQWDELKKIMYMDWDQFTRFCNANPRTRDEVV